MLEAELYHSVQRHQEVLRLSEQERILIADADSFTHPDVMGCMEDLLDAVSSGKSEKERRRRGVHAYRKMTNSHKRGWSVFIHEIDVLKSSNGTEALIISLKINNKTGF